MSYKFLNNSVKKENLILPESSKINSFLLKNNQAEIIKMIDFLDSEEKFLYIHGFLGTGKRQFINYCCEFLDKEVITLEYYCKEATVCDDILLSFIDIIEDKSVTKPINLSSKITTLNVKFLQLVSSIKKPFLIILHSFDDVLEENITLIKEVMQSVAKEKNIKIVLSTRAMKPGILGDLEEDKKIFLKALQKNIFKEFLFTNQINAAEQTIEDFYKYTRGYYYYVALSIKIMQAMKINLMEFLQKFNQSELSFDSFLGLTYLNLIPNTIRNFFWFLRTIRHGLTLNALAIFEIYDEFSIEYLKKNLMIFQVGETVYVQDYFLQKIDLSIPDKTEIKLHKYIIGIYEAQLKEPLKQRAITISRQAMRAEIEYHNSCINNIQEKKEPSKTLVEEKNNSTENKEIPQKENTTTSNKLKKALDFASEKKYTEAIETLKNIIDSENIDLQTLVEARLYLAQFYKEIAEYSLSSHYYDLVETYYKQHNEVINLNYLYYEITDLYFKMYKNERAIETIKKVIYSVDTPKSLMVNACTLLGNIYSEINNPQEAYSYYQKALESLDENVDSSMLAELYFKYALSNDDRGEEKLAFEYYNKCIAVSGENSHKALAYSNLASCYYENENFDEAINCFKKAYEIEKTNNNFDGIYYNASYLAKIYSKQNSKKAYNYLIEAKKCAEFINEEFYILESSIALGDYYYNKPEKYDEALKEYLKAKKISVHISGEIDTKKIENRINDMKLRMDTETFSKIMEKYGQF